MKFFRLKMVVLLFAMLSSSILHAETAYETGWLKTFGNAAVDGGESGESVATDSSGNFYITGKVRPDPLQTTADIFDVVISKYDPDGTIIWTRQLGTNNQDHGQSITTDSSGNVYVAGYTFGEFIGGGGSRGNVDGFIAKYDTNGTFLWVKQFGTVGVEYVNGVTIDSNANLYVTGRTNGTFEGESNSGVYDVFVAIYDTDGTRLLTKQFGSSRVDEGTSAVVGSDGALYVAGHTDGALDGQIHIGVYDAFLSKFEVITDSAETPSDIVEKWTSQFGTVAGDYAYGVTVGKNDTVIAGDIENIYVTGSTYRGFGGQTHANGTNQDIFVVAYHPNGDTLWTRLLGTIHQDEGLSVATDSSGNIYVTGKTNGSFPGDTYYNIILNKNAVVVAKLDNSGASLWVKQFGKDRTLSIEGRGIATDSSGNLYVTGRSMADSNERSSDILIAKLLAPTASNTAPVADAGVDFTIHIGALAALDGSSSNDPDGNDSNLIYAWELTTKPEGSNAVLSDVSIVAPTFTPDIPGNYVAKLTVTDELGKSSSPDTVTVNAYNTAPLANAGVDFGVLNGALATLDGSASYDPNGNDSNLIYAWELTTKPEGSNSVLSDVSVVAPTFTPDIPGEYIAELTVTDELGESSLPVSVTVNAYNVSPIADAGPDQPVVTIGTLVTLDGSGSMDENADVLSYVWTLAEKPEFSTAVLIGEDTVSPQFTADVNGEYTITLSVTDPWGGAGIDIVEVSFENIRPVADAGGNPSASVGDYVTLDGSASSDANGDPLDYSWSLVKPLGSASTLSNPTSSIAGFTPDMEGTYTASLVVNDGIVESDAATVEIVVAPLGTAAESVGGTIDLLNTMSEASFSNPNLRNALTNKLNAVLKMITHEQYEQAWNKLTGDILPKTDGCALYGEPDEQDWIETCVEQKPVYKYVKETIDLLETML